MHTENTQEGRVGKPTPVTIANEGAPSKRSAPSHFDSRCDHGDDFDDMADRGLQSETANRLRRIAQGLAGIREITRVLSVFETERLLEESDCGAAALSPRAHEGILRGAEVLADFLNQEVYALGADLVCNTAGAVR